MSSSVEQIKERLDIVDVVGSYLKLEDAGSNFKAPCPFHNEKTPSFFVSPSRGTYHCFGCDAGGDIFSFVQEIEGVDFYGALKVLGERAGVDIKQGGGAGSAKSDKDVLYSILEVATSFFERTLVTQKNATDYLKERGMTGVTAKNFRIGYAPDEWTSLLDELKSKGFKAEMIEKAGLIIPGKQGYYDRFRGRIMFPLADGAGRIVGFTGRVYPENEKAGGKYVNSPESDLYHKSKLLYGFDKAKLALRKEDACILVEGQMDLVMSHQAGIANAVAVSGTALTEEHLGAISRLTENLIIAFDADPAGMSAARRGIDHALSLGIDVRMANIPEGKDPADIIKKDPREWKRIISESEHIIDFYLSALQEKETDTHKLGKQIENTVFPLLLRVARKMDQARFVASISQALSISEEHIWDTLREVAQKEETTHLGTTQDKGEGSLVSQKSRRQTIERKIASILFWQETLENPLIDVVATKDAYKNIIEEEDFNRVFSLSDTIKKTLILEAEVYYEGTERLKSEIEGLLEYLREEIHKDTFTKLMNELREAEIAGNTELAQKLLKQCQEISKEMNMKSSISGET